MSLLKRDPSMTAWDPFQELRQMTERLNRMFGTGLMPTSEPSLAAFDWQPSVNISETEKAYLIKADLPEVKKEDIKVSFDNRVLTIEGERRQEKKEKTEKMHRVESSYGRFYRSFTMPEDADLEHVEAVHRDGALSLTVPKSEAKQSKPQQVKVS